MKSDFHLHTGYSGDTDVEPERMVQGAIEKGLKVVCFTDHHDADYTEDAELFELNTPLYMAGMQKLKKKYEDKIDMRIGVEIGLQSHLNEYYKEYTTQYPFDFVIGSSHLVWGRDPYYGLCLEGKEDVETYRKGFEDLLFYAKHIEAFDVMGHMDYIVRYGREREKHYSYEANADIIDEVLRTLIYKGKGIELNTSGFKYKLGFPHPHPTIVKRYKELGGEIITVGSDGHCPEHIAYDFDKVTDILKSCGFKYYTEFKERKANFCLLR